MASALLIVSLPARMFLVRDGASVTLLPLALFCVHAQLIDESFTAKLAQLADADPEKTRLKHLDDALKGELAIAADRYRPYDNLRINTDYLLASRNLNTAILEYAGSSPQQIQAFCFASFETAVRHDPGAYTRKVFRQFRWFLWPDAKTFFKDRTDLAGEYRLSAQSLTAHHPTRLRADLQVTRQHYEDDLAALAEAASSLAVHPKLTAFANGVARWALPLECFFILALLATHAWRPLRSLRSAGWAAFFLFLAPLGNAFGVCVVHALDIYRYRITYGGYWLFALAAMITFILAAVGRSRGHAAGKSLHSDLESNPSP
jgi:hypothetical protein